MSTEVALLEQFYSLNSRIAAGGVYWTQGQGSNISVKIGDKLWIKASGFRLDAVNPSQGVVCTELNSLRDSVLELLASSLDDDSKEQRYSDLLRRANGTSSNGYRPSMETGFHLLIPSPFVAHFHSLVGILAAALWKGDHQRETVLEAFRRAGYANDPFFIPQIKPGLALAEFFTQRCDSELILIENHGIILHGPEPSVMLEKWTRFENDLLEQKQLNLPAVPSDRFSASLESIEPLFPDFAVFLEKIVSHTEEFPANNAIRMLPSEKLWDSPNLRELWIAQWMLSHSNPSPCPLSKEISSVLGFLPTEMARKS